MLGFSWCFRQNGLMQAGAILACALPVIGLVLLFQTFSGNFEKSLKLYLLMTALTPMAIPLGGVVTLVILFLYDENPEGLDVMAFTVLGSAVVAILAFMIGSLINSRTYG